MGMEEVRVGPGARDTKVGKEEHEIVMGERVV